MTETEIAGKGISTESAMMTAGTDVGMTMIARIVIVTEMAAIDMMTATDATIAEMIAVMIAVTIAEMIAEMIAETIVGMTVEMIAERKIDTPTVTLMTAIVIATTETASIAIVTTATGMMIAKGQTLCVANGNPTPRTNMSSARNPYWPF